VQCECGDIGVGFPLTRSQLRCILQGLAIIRHGINDEGRISFLTRSLELVIVCTAVQTQQTHPKGLMWSNSTKGDLSVQMCGPQFWKRFRNTVAI
jgi:hypothetical protein